MNSDCLRCGTARPTPDTRFCPRCGSRLDAPVTVDPLLGSTLLGRYKVVRTLGEGSMGRVYLGEQRVGAGARKVAIKILGSSQDPYLIERFRREAAIVAALEHPNIVKMYDYGEEDGRFVSVMEYLPAGSLGQLIGNGVMDNGRVENILGQIARALDEAHRRGVVHRDLKPENILLATVADGRGQLDVVKVVDFGIARRPKDSAEERTLTVTGALMGTPAYMAPEQFTAEKVDARVDVYALGLIGFQMLTGRLPWRASSVVEWAHAHKFQPPAPLTSLPGFEQMSPRYERAILHALEKSPEARTPSALAFIDEFVSRGDARGASATVEMQAPVIAPPSMPAPPPPGPRPSSAPNDSLEPPRPAASQGKAALALYAVVGALCLAVGYLVVRLALR
ncbi:MAG: serine/threonine-protein kinase [Polyangiales bacterium]